MPVLTLLTARMEHDIPNLNAAVDAFVAGATGNGEDIRAAIAVLSFQTYLRKAIWWHSRPGNSQRRSAHMSEIVPALWGYALAGEAWHAST
jgi:hypothetical protein